MRTIILMLCLVVSVAAQQSSQFPSVKSEPAKPPIVVSPDHLKVIQERYQGAIEAQGALNVAKALFSDQPAIVDRFQKELDLRIAQMNVLMLQEKVALGVPASATFDPQTGIFSVPPDKK